MSALSSRSLLPLSFVALSLSFLRFARLDVPYLHRCGPWSVAYTRARLGRFRRGLSLTSAPFFLGLFVELGFYFYILHSTLTSLSNNAVGLA